MKSAIELQNISKNFGSTIGVDNVSFDIREGEFLTLLGPSGCGKTTLLRIIGGFATPTSGKVILDGRDETDTPPNKRAVNMVFQDYALFPHMSVGANVSYGLRVGGSSKAQQAAAAADALALVGLSDKTGAKPHELSGGQRQRVALARAIARRPKVLLLDEPLSALDANLREQMQIELMHLHKQVGLTFVLVTHDQTEALVMSDRVVVMRDGRIEQMGTPSELYDKAANSYVANFVGSTNIFTSVVGESEGENVTLDFQGQKLLAARTQRVGARGVRQFFGFRPEKIRLLTGEAGANSLKAIVSRVLYQGLGVRIILSVGAVEISADMLLSDAFENAGVPRDGDAVFLQIDPHKVQAFEEAGQ